MINADEIDTLLFDTLGTVVDESGSMRAELGAALERAARDVRLVFGQETLRLSISQLGDAHPLFEALEHLDGALSKLAEALAAQAERAGDGRSVVDGHLDA